VLKEFREFIARGNVLDLAIAVVIGAAFGRIVTTLVEGVLMPPIGLALGRVDFSSLFVVLDRSGAIPASIAEAKARGIPVVAYGALLNDIISFLIVAFVVFLIVKQANRFKPAAPAAVVVATRECPYCLSAIPAKARRCAACCADVSPA
jgi:large conductance mechanosensitive channel